MSVVKINAIAVPEGMGAELEKRFAARVGAVEKMPGFEGFELLRPTNGE
jgi:heme-degrading monooxygenase HmoA